MNKGNKEPEELTKEDLYALVQKYLIRELKLRDMSLDRASDLAKAVLSHLEDNLVEANPYEALIHLTKEFPEIMEITLSEQEKLAHRYDQQVVDYISYYLKNGDLDKIEEYFNSNS